MIGIISFLLLVASTSSYGWSAQAQAHMDQASTLIEFRASATHNHPVSVSDTASSNLVSCLYEQKGKETASYDDHLMKDGLPGQPAASGVNFKQYAGEINVDESTGRALFYYFVESSSNSSMNPPLILWLNGGPSCSSFGKGALTQIGPFGVNPDGKTLYARNFSWNKVANVLFLESPAGVGFPYSNTTSDYNSTGDQMTAEDTDIFLVKWFERYPMFKGRDFYLTGESYAGNFIRELADIILHFVNNTNGSTPMMNLKGIMIGNGLMDEASDNTGAIDFAWSHALISDETHNEFYQRCTMGGNYESESCSEAYVRLLHEISNINYFNVHSPLFKLSLMTHPPTGHSDLYLNLPEVQIALNANKTKLHYPWEPSSSLMHHGWKDKPSSMFPIYKRLMSHGLRILLYSGDVDSCVSVTGSRYALARMGLKVIEPWHWWNIPNTSEVAGYKVVYDGLTYFTVLGAGHEVSRSHPDRLYALLNDFLAI